MEKNLKIISWNVNSIRSRIVDGFISSNCKIKKRTIKKSSSLGKLINNLNPDIICLQETKCFKNDTNCFEFNNFNSIWNCSKIKKNHSGVLTLVKPKFDIIKIDKTLNLKKESQYLNNEGRFLAIYTNSFVIINIYTPSTISFSKTNKKILIHRKNFDKSILKYIKKVNKTKYKNKIIICGDFNVIPTVNDYYKGEFSKIRLKNTKDEKEKIKLQKRINIGILEEKYGGSAGFRKSERKEFHNLIKQSKLIDVYDFLKNNKIIKKPLFTYWNLRQKHFRKFNNGLRIDFFLISKTLKNNIIHYNVYKEIGEKNEKLSSDHAPIFLSLKLNKNEK